MPLSQIVQFVSILINWPTLIVVVTILGVAIHQRRSRRRDKAELQDNIDSLGTVVAARIRADGTEAGDRAPGSRRHWLRRSCSTEHDTETETEVVVAFPGAHAAQRPRKRPYLLVVLPLIAASIVLVIVATIASNLQRESSISAIDTARVSTQPAAPSSSTGLVPAAEQVQPGTSASVQGSTAATQQPTTQPAPAMPHPTTSTPNTPAPATSTPGPTASAPLSEPDAPTRQRRQQSAEPSAHHRGLTPCAQSS